MDDALQREYARIRFAACVSNLTTPSLPQAEGLLSQIVSNAISSDGHLALQAACALSHLCACGFKQKVKA